MLKFLVDESSGKKLCTNLKAEGFDAIYVGDIMGAATDEEVLKYAQKEGRILISNDKDFGELIFRRNKPSSGVVLLRIKNDVPSARTECIFSLIKKIGEKLSGTFIVLTEEKYRIRTIKDSN